MTEQEELGYSKILEALCSEKIIVMCQAWKKGSALPERLEVVYSTHPSPRYAVGQKHEFGSGIYNMFLFDPVREGYDVLIVNEEDGKLAWYAWDIKQYPIKR